MSTKLAPLEEGITLTLSALEAQINRRMQRDERVKGVKKWEPLEEKLEEMVSLILDYASEEPGIFEPLLVTSQAYAKALRLICEELGTEGVGELRSAYAVQAAANIERECRLIKSSLDGEPTLN